MTTTRRKPTRRKQLVTDDQYNELLTRQNGVCAICGRPPKEGGRRLNVDHDHRSGTVRGLLCFVCNHHILGKYATPAKLRAAADYLDKHRAVSMRVDGATWDEIAEALGVTRQTVYARYGALIRYSRSTQALVETGDK